MRFFALFLSILMIVAFISGCDEGMDMVGPVIIDKEPEEPVEEPQIPEEPVEEPQIPEEPITFYIHGDGTSEKLASEHTKEVLAQNEKDFVGCVFIPKARREADIIHPVQRRYAHPLSDVTVTIMSGPRSGGKCHY